MIQNIVTSIILYSGTAVELTCYPNVIFCQKKKAERTSLTSI